MKSTVKIVRSSSQLSALSVLMIAVSLSAVGNAQNLAKPMADMDPDLLTGWWYVWKRTGGLWDSPHCARSYVESKGGDDYRINFCWINSKNKVDHQAMEVIDDRSVKANFLLASDTHKVAFTVLDTDYDNYFVARAVMGDKNVYYYGGRSVDHITAYDGRADDIFKDNEIVFPFHVVNYTNCPDDGKFYLPSRKNGDPN